MLLNHGRAIAHLLAERVYVSVPTQEFKCGVGVTQRIQGSVLSVLVLQQARVTHQPPESAAQAWRLVAVTEPEQLVGQTLYKCRLKRHYGKEG